MVVPRYIVRVGDDTILVVMKTETGIFQSPMVVLMVIVGWYNPDGKTLNAITEEENSRCQLRIVGTVGDG